MIKISNLINFPNEMREKKRGQVSVEYLIVVGFIVFLVIGILGVALVYIATIRDQIKISQVENYAQKIIAASESVFYAGSPSKTTITAYLPIGVTSITINDAENIMIISLETDAGVTTRAFPSNVPIKIKENKVLSTSEGVKRITISARSNYAEVDEE